MLIQNCVLLDSLENDDSTTASGVTFCLILRLYILVTWQCITSLLSKVCTMFKRNKPTKVQEDIPSSPTGLLRRAGVLGVADGNESTAGTPRPPHSTRPRWTSPNHPS